VKVEMARISRMGLISHLLIIVKLRILIINGIHLCLWVKELHIFCNRTLTIRNLKWDKNLMIRFINKLIKIAINYMDLMFILHKLDKLLLNFVVGVKLLNHFIRYRLRTLQNRQHKWRVWHLNKKDMVNNYMLWNCVVIRLNRKMGYH